MHALFELCGDSMRYLFAVIVAVLPRRWWSRFETQLPMQSAAVVSGIVTSCLGFAIDVTGTLNFVFESSASRNATLIAAAGTNPRFADALWESSSALTALSFLYFPFFTPLGLFATYLTVSGAVRWFSAWFDDPRGDFVLSRIDWAAVTLFRKSRDARTRIAREWREGPETPDRLFAGDWAGVDADYVVVASRRKAEWEPGAIILTSTDWYRLGVPFDIETPGGLRTAYPLTKLEAVEVVRRGIQYELPRLSRGRKP